MSSPFSALPIELILSVISVAADHQPTALALSLVSSWVHTHVEPALYHTVRLRSARSLTSFICTLDGKLHGFAHRTVKKLCITALGPISRIQTVLSRCTGVTSLASGFPVPSYIYCVRGQLSLEEQKGTMVRCLPIAPKEQHLLSFACRDGLDMAIISPAVSRLRIQLTPAVTSESIARLAELRLLTHLALVYSRGRSGGLDAIKDMLQPIIQGGRLRVLVLQVAGGAEDAHLEEIRRWNQIRGERSSENVVDGKRLDLIISASKAPRSFLSEWEGSDAFWQHVEDSIGSVVA
jgi:hypothetical protein